MAFKRSSHRLILFIATVVFSFCLIVLSPAMASPKNKTGNKIKTLDFAIQYIFDGNFDPVEKNFINLQFLFRSIYSAPFKLNTHLRIEPLLLEKYERNGKQIILYIKENARFSDGSPITAEDMRLSFEAGMTLSDSPNPVYKWIEGGEELFQGKTPHCTGLKTLGDKILEIRLKEENAEIETYFTANTMSILPRHRNRERKPGGMVFSGPFQVTDYREKGKESIVTLKKNPHYFGPAGKIDVIYLHFYKESSDYERIIDIGKPDVFLYNQGLTFPSSRHKYNYFKTPSFGAFYIKLNPREGPFKDKKLRTYLKDIILSLDLVENEKWELMAPCKMILPYSLTGYFVFDPIAPGNFQELMPKKTIKISCLNPNYGIRTTLMPLLKKKLKKYNLDLELKWAKNLDIVRFQERKASFDLTTLYYLVDIPLSSYFYETLFTPGHELNLFGYKVPKAMELLADYRKEDDELKKLKVLSQLETIAQEEAFLIPLMNPLSILGYKDSVKNVKIDKFLQINFEDIDVE